MRSRFVALATVVAIVLPAVANGELLSGRVVGVADGDTLTVLDNDKTQHRIRLAEIDAPEGGQPFGNRSKRLLSELCFREQARVSVTTQDRYGRSVGFVECRGVDANAELIRSGLAWVYVRYARPDSPYFSIEREAREGRRGLWSDPHAVAPWEWRRGVRSQSGPAGDVEDGASTVRGNQRSRVYHLPHCPSFESVSEANRVAFESATQAERNGFRRAGNCP